MYTTILSYHISLSKQDQKNPLKKYFILKKKMFQRNIPYFLMGVRVIRTIAIFRRRKTGKRKNATIIHPPHSRPKTKKAELPFENRQIEAIKRKICFSY